MDVFFCCLPRCCIPDFCVTDPDTQYERGCAYLEQASQEDIQTSDGLTRYVEYTMNGIELLTSAATKTHREAQYRLGTFYPQDTPKTRSFMAGMKAPPL